VNNIKQENILILCIIIIIGTLTISGIVLAQTTNSTNNTTITNNTTNITNSNTTNTITNSSESTNTNSVSSNSNSRNHHNSNLVKDENSEIYGKLSYDSEGNEYWTGQGDDGGIYTSRNGATSDGGYNHNGVHYNSTGRPTCGADGIY
jgi:hypothetical protein